MDVKFQLYGLKGMTCSGRYFFLLLCYLTFVLQTDLGIAEVENGLCTATDFRNKAVTAWKKLYSSAELIMSHYKQEVSANLKMAQSFESWALLEKGSLGDAVLRIVGCLQNLSNSKQVHAQGSCVNLVRALLYELKQISSLSTALTATKAQKQLYQQAWADLESKKSALEKFQLRHKLNFSPVSASEINAISVASSELTDSGTTSGPSDEDMAIVSTISSASLLSGNIGGTVKLSQQETKALAGTKCVEVLLRQLLILF